MAKSIGSVAAVLSLNSGQFTAGLADASSQLKNFGRSVSDAFGKSLPNMGLPVFGGQGLTAQQKELAAINDAAILAQKNVAGIGGALHLESASHGIKALSGSLFLLTGQTGFFVIEAARAASHVSKFVQSSGGLAGAFTSAASAASALLAPLGPLGAAVLGLGAAYAALSYAMSISNDESEKAKKIAEEGLPIYQKELEVADRLRVAKGEITEFEAKRKAEERRLGRGMNEGERTSFDNTLLAEQDIKRLELGKEVDRAAFENHVREVQKAVADEIALKQKLAEAEDAFRKEQIDRDWEFQKDRVRIAAEEEQEKRKIIDDLAKDQKEAAKSALVASGAAKESQLESDPVKRTLMDFQERIDALRNSKDKIGADFGISSASFRDAPIGQVIGPQTEQSKTNEHLEDIKEIQRQLLNYVETNGLGVTIDG